MKRRHAIPNRHHRRGIAKARRVALAIAVAAAAHANAASPEGPSGGESAPEIRPPELVRFIAAEYPNDAREAGLEGVVLLELTIDREGKVVDVQVTRSAGHGFDEAARGAALRFAFVPARRGDMPVAARIAYRYEFHLPSPPPSSHGSDPPRAGDGAGLEPWQVAAPRSAGPLEAPEPVTTARPAASAPGMPDRDVSGARGSAQPRPGGAPTPVEVTVQGSTVVDRRRSSAEAVTVLELGQAGRGSADMGEVLARAQGVGVRREGGLGSSTRLSLNGLTDDQIRFFLDGVPLELAGYPFGIANIPVGLVDRVEIYGGVVPVRFGADALGGAVDLVTARQPLERRVGVAYQVGSFDTHRLALSGDHRQAPSGLVVRVNAFFDRTRNDYAVDVDVPDAQGRLSSARIHRFHDMYRAGGANVELGVRDSPWAKRLLVRVYATDYHKDYQHNRVMTVPYGGVTYRERSAGVSLRYEQPLGRGISFDGIGGYGHARGRFLDVATCVYDWFGRCVRERTQPGEIDGRPHDRVQWDHSAFGRFHLRASLSRSHLVRLTLAPTYLARTGDERRQSEPNVVDPLTARRELVTVVDGLEYKADLLGGRLENIAFAKHYVQRLGVEEPLAGHRSRQHGRSIGRFGVGNGMRYRLAPWLYAKASYEWATRLPRADEVFGDNAFVVANLDLRPETSHNANLGLTVDARESPLGALRAGFNGVLRDADQLIVLLGTGHVQSHQNVLGARALGIEGSAGWTAPGSYLAVDANVTWLDFRNTSRDGPFVAFAGDRIPNRPQLFANATARVQLRGAIVPQDEILVMWNTHYVHAFYRGWESIGLPQFKQVIPTQLVHAATVGYRVHDGHTDLSMTIDVQNVADARTFDFFGVQRPGRAFYVKTTVEF